jgi:arylsulfatase
MPATTRREFIRQTAVGLTFGLPLAAHAMSRIIPLSRSTPPNIVLIMADDMGYSDLGCYGSEIRTPTLDQLAAQGLRYSQFYNCARCCPTRASLLTGLYPHQAGVGHMIGDYHLPGYRGFLNDRCVTIAEVLKTAGYTTLMSGKWHVGEERPHWPCDRGFDQSYTLISGASSYWELSEGRQMARNDQPFTPNADDWYITDAFTSGAVTLLDTHARGPAPFFLYLPYTAPHWPLHAYEDDVTPYLDIYAHGWDAIRAARHQRMKEIGMIDPAWELSPRDGTPWADVDDKDELVRRMAVYAAQVERMDRGIGDVLAKLDQLGQADNTLVLFLADNGGCAEVVDRSARSDAVTGSPASFRSYGRTWANASNTPLRRYKKFVNEGGIATPLIARWPRRIKAHGRVDHQPGHVIDIMATCVDATGAEYPVAVGDTEITPMEGLSLAPTFANRLRTPHATLCWEHQGNRAVREGDWKIVATRRDGGEWSLYNVMDDRTECHDLAQEQPERVTRMAAIYDDWAARCNVVPFDEARPKRG